MTDSNGKVVKAWDPATVDRVLRGIEGNPFSGGLSDAYYQYVRNVLYSKEIDLGGIGQANRLNLDLIDVENVAFGTNIDVSLAPLSAKAFCSTIPAAVPAESVNYTITQDSNDYRTMAFVQNGQLCVIVVSTSFDAQAAPSAIVTLIRPNDPEPSEGETWGDPHIFTLDGGIYTFMATGDYILSESTDPSDNFVVQVRFRPFEGPTWAHVDSTQWSANEAVAMNIHGDIVEFYAVDDYAQPLAIINGVQVPAGDAVIPLPRGGTVELRGRRASASWRDGTSLSTELNTSMRGDWSIAGRVNLSLPASRWRKVQGLMGNNDGIVRNDLRLRDGTQLSLDPTPQGYNFSSEQLTRELYSGPFRSSWLVQSSESLFSRGVNRFDPFYPSELVSLDDLDPALIRLAEQACGLQGIRSAAVLSRCVLDVANTGDELFAALAAAVDPLNPGITIKPQTLYFTSPEARELTAFVKGQVSDTRVSWRATAGTITGTGNTITFTPPTTKGTYSVTATLTADPSVQAIATTIVGEPLVIAPTEVTLPADGTHVFAAFGAEGQTINWSASGGFLSSSGRTVTYTAPARAGEYTVTASLAADSSVRATATVQVYGTQLTPFVATVKPGESRTFTWLNAEALEPTWSTTGGSITGSGHSVTFNAPASEGQYVITATSSIDPSLRATARVFVTDQEVATILYHADTFLGTDYLGQAMRPYNVTYAHSWSDFNEKLDSGAFDLAIALVQNWYEYPDADIMANHVHRGGRVIYTDWTRDFRFHELFEFEFTGRSNSTAMTLQPPLDDGLSNPVYLINPGWRFYSMGLRPAGNGTSLCTFQESGDSCLVVGNEGRTVVLGFLADVPFASGGEQLFSNIMNLFNVAFELAGTRTTFSTTSSTSPTSSTLSSPPSDACYPVNNTLCGSSR
jgi:hypothetical protein